MKKSGNYIEDYLIPKLKNSQYAADYLNDTLENGDIHTFLLALQNVVKAQGGIATIAEKAHMSRSSLYKTLSEKGNPYLKGTKDILSAMGLRLMIKSRE